MQIRGPNQSHKLAVRCPAHNTDDSSTAVRGSGVSTTSPTLPATYSSVHTLPKVIYNPQTINIVESPSDLGSKAAEHVISAIKENPNAVIILPTGSTPIPMYKTLIERFRQDTSLNLSNVTFFNLDEYLGLPKDHPLSYNFYMEQVLYSKLHSIDPDRAPKKENCHVPYAELNASDFDNNGNLIEAAQVKVNEAASQYRNSFLEAIRQRGKADLVVLGIGGAYPVELADGAKTVKGGHIAFNEPGSNINDETRALPISDKTILDTRYRFRNIKYLQRHNGLDLQLTADVPRWAITMGIDEIVNYTDKAILLANGEEKAHVIEAFNNTEPSENFPSTFLKLHPNYHLILDNEAASKIPKTQSPWNTLNSTFEWDEEKIRQLVIKACTDESVDLSNLRFEHLASQFNTDSTFLALCRNSFETIKAASYDSLQDKVFSNIADLSSVNGKKVIIFSPHPDDDVICCSATIKKLIELGADVHVVYVTSGENAVRNDLLIKPANFDSLQKPEQDDVLKELKTEVREKEATDAVTKLGVRAENITFLRSPFYYTRGFVHIDALSPTQDIEPVKRFLNNLQPDYIFYSAENDPHGAHGLSAKAIKESVKDEEWAKQSLFWGYRGAYNEWPLYREPEKLVILPYDDETWQLKEEAIKAHTSQLNPLFPSFDSREFFERAHDRNRDTGLVLQRLGVTSQHETFAEVFCLLNHSEFIK